MSRFLELVPLFVSFAELCLSAHISGSSGFCLGKVGGKGEGREHAVIAPQTPTRHSRESGNPVNWRTVMQSAMGLGRKDGNTGSFHRNGWIPAFAGMT